MNVLVACKVVIEEQDIAVQKDGTLDLSKAMPKINPFDLNAIQAAVELKRNNADINVVGISVGDEKLNVSKVRKDLLSRGLDELHISVENKGMLTPPETAGVLSQIAKEVGFDLIVCGDGSADYFASQVGLRMGAKLDIPAINGVSQIVSMSADHIVVHRELEDEIEELEVALPAVIAVTADSNIPEIPGMKAILAASKKKTIENAVAVQEEASEVVEQIVAPTNKARLGKITADDSDENIDSFASELKNIL